MFVLAAVFVNVFFSFSFSFSLATNCPLCPIEESACQSMILALLHTQSAPPECESTFTGVAPIPPNTPPATIHSLARQL